MEEILKKVLELYRKYGIKSITMDDVARELAMSKKTLYQYVKDKEELVEAATDYEFTLTARCMEELMSRGLNAIDEMLEVSQFVKLHLKQFSHSMDYDLQKYYPDIHSKVKEKRRENMYRYILSNMNKGKEQGVYRADLDAEIIARMHVARIETMHDDSMFTREELNHTKVFREFFIYHVRGIASAEGIKILEANMDKLNDTES